ncbi:putative E3 ubiquitin-protein ligase HERC3 [Porphyridium purpureum]|uniref:Putative E3 ubiquitin-protein ligase HERC3 n=1 Tax=Porphyridium purpureum TaxID=35688 RepID=A0A5J4ZA08_PORPP|nr:putative E3 ubiquitin-protein ligase HERC3 [Porphyridium purpureum]|eukprot:POR2299..scf295_1
MGDEFDVDVKARNLFGWGSAAHGQLGTTAGVDLLPVPAELHGFGMAEPVLIAANGFCSVVLTRAGQVFCSRESARQKPRRPPAQEPPPGHADNEDCGCMSCSEPFEFPPIAQLAVGKNFYLALTEHGTVLGWGSNAEVFSEPSAVPSVVKDFNLHRDHIVKIAAGTSYWLALSKDGYAYYFGQVARTCADHQLSTDFLPQKPGKILRLVGQFCIDVSCGADHYAVLTSTGVAYIFGNNEHGQLGIPDDENERTVSRGEDINQAPISCRKCIQFSRIMHYSYIKGTGPVHKEGARRRGLDSDAGDASSGSASPLLVLQKPLGVTRVACGDEHTLLLTSDGSVLAFGNGQRGQLGHCSSGSSSTPVLVRLPQHSARVTALAAGKAHSVALTCDGEVLAWGSGTEGQIGDGDMLDKLIPVSLGRPESWYRGRMRGRSRNAQSVVDQIACGSFHTVCVVMRDSVVAEGSLHEMEVDTEQMPNGQSRESREELTAWARKNSVDALERLSSANWVMKTFGVFGVLPTLDWHSLEEVQQAALTSQGAAPGYTRKAREQFMEEIRNVVGDEHVRSDEIPPEVALMLLIALAVPSTEASCDDLSEVVIRIAQLPKRIALFFVHAAGEMSDSMFEGRVVRPLQLLISSELIQNNRVTDVVMNAARVLVLLFAASLSQRSKDRPHGKLHPSAFHNSTVSASVDLRTDYERWLKHRASKAPSAEADRNGISPGTNDGQEGERKTSGIWDGLSRTERTIFEPWESQSTYEFGGPRRRSILDILAVLFEDAPSRFSFCGVAPFLLNEKSKSRLLRAEAVEEQRHQQFRSLLRPGGLIPLRGGMVMSHSQFCVIHVRRDHVIEDAVNCVQFMAPSDLRKPLRVEFHGEPGVDEGGVRKEFFQILTEKLFSADYGMFIHNEDTNLNWFNRNALDMNEYYLVGLIVGLAMYNNVILDLRFPSLVYSVLLSQKQIDPRSELPSRSPWIRFDNAGAAILALREVFPDHARSLEALLAHEPAEDVEDVFCLSFEVDYDFYGERKSVDLIEDGSSIPVTGENRAEFVIRYSEYILGESIMVQMAAFQSGFLFIMGGGAFLDLLTPSELETLVCGEPSLDFAALKKNCKYEGGYDAESQVVAWFWECLLGEELSLEQKRKFLFFVSGCDRAPVGGLENMKLILQRAGPDTGKLPTSHTCFNVFLLPEYSSREKLLRLLLIAIENAQGFGLQ